MPVTEYIVKFRKYYGTRDCWAESSDGENGRNAVIAEILDSDFEVACVLAVDCEDFKYAARDVTDEIMEEVRDREVKALRDRYDAENPNMTFSAYLWSHTKFARAA